MERNKRKVLTGIVTSDKMEKTITVQVESYKKHRLYGKRVKQSSKFAVHDEANEALIGDTVKIVETRPLSKNKYFRLLEITGRKS
jgi:small subunit ribosomal protein S17